MGERKNEKSNWPVFPVDASGDGFLPAIHRHFPQGGEKWLSGSQHNITWTFSNIPGSTLVKLLLFRNGAKVGTIAENIPIGSNGAGTYVWPAGSYVGGAADAGDGYQVCIRDVNNQFPFAMSPGTFSFNRYCDLDSGYEISTVPGCDFWWSQNSIPPHQRILIPATGAKFKTLGVWSEFSYQSLHSTSGYSDYPIVDAELPINMVVGYVTDQARCGAMRVVAKDDDGSITVAWVTYDN